MSLAGRNTLKMKILVSAYACNPSSSQKLHPGEDQVGWQMVRQIAAAHDAWVICHSYNRPGVEEALNKESLPGVRFHFLELPRPFWMLYKIGFGERLYYYLWQIWAWRLARKLHRAVEFDLIHHLTFGNDWIASWSGAFLPIPFILGPVGGGHTTPGPLWKEYSFYGRFAEGARSVAQWFGRRDPVRRRSVRRASAILVCNRETREKLAVRYRPKTSFFPVNGISREDLVSLESIVPRAVGRTFKVLMAARFHRLKGISIAIRAFAKFADQHENVEFMIVGSGPEEGRLKTAAAASPAAKKIIFKSWLSRKEVILAMRTADVFLFPSFRDGGGAVVVEAMAQGCPVICLDTAGPGFHIEPEWGIKVPPGEPGAVVSRLASALDGLYRNEDDRLRLGIAGRQRAESFYTWDRLGQRISDIYLDVFTRRPGGQAR